MVQKYIDKRLLIALKEKSPLYVDGAGLTNNKKMMIHP